MPQIIVRKLTQQWHELTTSKESTVQSHCLKQAAEFWKLVVKETNAVRSATIMSNTLRVLHLAIKPQFRTPRKIEDTETQEVVMGPRLKQIVVKEMTKHYVEPRGEVLTHQQLAELGVK